MNARLPSSVLNAGIALDQVSAQWDGDIVRQISEYIAIPAKSPGFDSDWAQHGFIDTVVRNAASWIRGAKSRRPDAGSGAFARPHAGAVF